MSGAVHAGTPTGKIETIDSLPTYVAAPKDGSKAKSIVFIVDSMFRISGVLHCTLIDQIVSFRMAVPECAASCR